MTLKVSDIGEKELVRYIISNSKDITPDDTAITNFNDTNLISTCDMLIQSRHFPKNMTYFGRNCKWNPDNLIKRNQDHRKGIGLQIAQQICAENGNCVDADAGYHKVSHKSKYLEIMDPVPRDHLEQVNAQNATAHIAEDAADGDSLVEAVVLYDSSHLLFATFPILGLPLCVDAAEGGFY